MSSRPGSSAATVTLPSGQKRLPFDHHDDRPPGGRRPAGALPGGPRPRPALESDEFTLSELYAIHSLITAGEEHRDTFRRRVEPRLSELGVRKLAVGRPANLDTFDRD